RRLPPDRSRLYAACRCLRASAQAAVEAIMNAFEDLGLKPIINASGAVTRLGGAPMPEAVLEAFCHAARESVRLDQLQAAASREIAAITGAEAGLVTSGASAALM